MYKKIITYVDYNDIERIEPFYFNLTEAELVEMRCSTTGGLEEYMKRMIETTDEAAMVKIVKEIILKSYGIKSDDGRRFIKTKEITDSFEQNPAFSVMFMELATDDEATMEFIKGILPKKLAEEAAAAAIKEIQ